ncbi:MAG: hypothetical protein GY950_06430 [bacterium]|nr:hypothetical protein [bacterium]
MKKIIIMIVLPYLLVMAAIFYFFFGPGLVSGYEPLEWENIETIVPAGFEVKPYKNKGWDVYYLQKLTSSIKIALKPGVDVARLHENSRNVIYRTSSGASGVGDTYYLSNPPKTFEVVFAKRMDDDVTIYFSVVSASVFSARYIMDKITGSCFYKGEKISLPAHDIPSKCYLTDYLFLGGMLLPLVLIIAIFYFSGKRPPAKYFEGDPIRCEESYVYFNSARKYRRKNSFCFLALTSTRLMVFLFMKPIWEVRLREDDQEITIEGNKIIMVKEKEKITLKSSKIEEWKSHLAMYSY